MLLSIIIPTYNSANYLLRCIKSIEIINNFLIEIIIVDDGSTDATAEYVKKLINDTHKIIYIYQTNMGPGNARNRGIEVSSGKYITFIDADDTYEPNQLLRLLLSLKQFNYKYDIICFGYEMIEGNGNKIGGIKYKNSNFVNPLNVFLTNNKIKDVVWNKIYKSEIIKNNNVKFPFLKAREDSIFNIRAFSNAVTLKLFDGVVYVHHSENISSLSANFSIYSMFEVCKSINLEFKSIRSLENKYVDENIIKSRAFKIYLYAFIYLLQKEKFNDTESLKKHRLILLNLINDFDIGWQGKVLYLVTSICLASKFFSKCSSQISKKLVKFSH